MQDDRAGRGRGASEPCVKLFGLVVRRRLRGAAIWGFGDVCGSPSSVCVTLTYFQPTTLRHLAQEMSATTCMPVVISRSSLGPDSTLTQAWNSQAGPFLLWNCCRTRAGTTHGC